MPGFEKILSGGDLRSIGKSNTVVLKIKNQNEFDELFNCLFHTNLIVVMRAADAIEKITILQPEYLKQHKKEIFELSKTATDKELKWHLALLLPRFSFSKKELGIAWTIVSGWACDRKNSRIVRVNSIQALYELMKQEPALATDFSFTLSELERENIPSVNARIRKIRKAIATKIDNKF